MTNMRDTYTGPVPGDRVRVPNPETTGVVRLVQLMERGPFLAIDLDDGTTIWLPPALVSRTEKHAEDPLRGLRPGDRVDLCGERLAYLEAGEVVEAEWKRTGETAITARIRVMVRPRTGACDWYQRWFHPTELVRRT